jgi:hypothetical protein
MSEAMPPARIAGIFSPFEKIKIMGASSTSFFPADEPVYSKCTTGEVIVTIWG